jgi:hypothetical protein
VDWLKIDPVALIAERKILEAMEQGLFDDLPGRGKPLPEDEFANLPDEVRLCARILKSSSFMESRSGSLEGLPVSSLIGQGNGGARNAFRGMERLSLRLKPPDSRAGKVTAAPDESPRVSGLLDSPYLGRVLAKLF